ncbi:MAG TPA: MlaD family protein [Burkholderiaceae bacterium]|nr:MlaD family protein [Burkholderiaceae bacterium]
MTETTDTPQEPGASVPEMTVVRRKRMRVSLVWLVPIAALVVGAILVVRALTSVGPEITITFRTAEGLEPGRTEVRFKEVAVGKVSRVALSPDRERVMVTVKLDKSAESLAVDDTRFWVVKARVGLAGVTGLGTLFSGSYIGVDAGASEEGRTHFTGLESPPLVLRDEPGRIFHLDAAELGSLDVGSPVYYRRARVGRVVGYALDAVRDTLDVQVLIEAPNEPLVTNRSRFWNTSGIDVTLDANGFQLNTESLISLITGGVAFANIEGEGRAEPAGAESRFELFSTRKAALAPPDGPAQRIRMVFEQAQRGLVAGAPVDMLGIQIGKVRGVRLMNKEGSDRFPVEVTADLFLERLGSVRSAFKVPTGAEARADALFLKRLVDAGMRAQVRTGNLLTGQLYVALDFPPKVEKATLDANVEPPTVPSIRGTLADLQPQVADIVARLGKIRFDEIGKELQATLQRAGAASDGLKDTLASANATIKLLTPEAQRALVDVQKTLNSAQTTLANLDRNVAQSEAPMQQNMNQALVEMRRTAQALRVLADYLQRHPEALVRGKPADPDPASLSSETKR